MLLRGEAGDQPSAKVFRRFVHDAIERPDEFILHPAAPLPPSVEIVRVIDVISNFVPHFLLKFAASE
ncbi:hypothetical protein OsI_10581 [Oryza sativa Indica Group]|uniref:Uncharacterized protein n=1 Tax=Oryza sativa subsp. indica TaxID=39946 RepID=B8AJK2_ORYSI|nr:hypothetical protein OsI_10581 [Oryza sativa Indica Group]